MLSNQHFVDPSIAINIKKLQDEMKSLLEQKIQIQYHDKLIDPKRKAELLRINEQQRQQLRKIIEKSKLSMVEYFDKQVQVINIDCIKNGQVISKNHLSFEINNQNLQNGFQLLKCENELQLKKQKSYSTKSKHSQSTNYKSHIEYLHDKSSNKNNISSNRLDKSDINDKSYIHMVNSAASIQQRQEKDNKFIYESNENIKQRKSCLSTHYRTNSGNGSNSGLLNRNKKKVEQYNILNGSLIQNKCNSSQIMQINQFNITSNSIKNNNWQNINNQNNNKSNNNNKILYSNQSKQPILSYLANQQYLNEQYSKDQSQLEQFDQISQLYNRKIQCLQQKCNKLQVKNKQMSQIIQYQQNTIHQLEQIIQYKQNIIESRQSQIIQMENKFCSIKNNYQNKISQLTYCLKQISTFIQSNKSIIKNVITPNIIQIINNSNKYQSHVPISLQSSSLPQPKSISQLIPQKSILIPQHSSFYVLPSQNQISNQPDNSSQMYKQNTQSIIHKDQLQILNLSKQLLQLQNQLKSIQHQNQQLKGQRKLLLKKITFN